MVMCPIMASISSKYHDITELNHTQVKGTKITFFYLDYKELSYSAYDAIVKLYI